MRKVKVYQQIATSFQAMLNCEKSGNSEWFARHEETIENICKNHMPSGSGFDCGTRFDFDNSTPEKLIFITDYHHMDENGMYDGWGENVKIVVTPSLQFNFLVKITGVRRKNRDDLDYWYDTFDYALRKEIEVER